MPYRSYNELIEDASEDPKLARMRVNRAKQNNSPVVDSDNPGYGRDNNYKDYRDKAITKRMSRTGNKKPDSPPDPPVSRKKFRGDLSKAIESRMKNFSPPSRQARGSKEEEIVNNRKKPGY